MSDEKVKIPTLKIGDKIVTPTNPKMLVWRKFLAFFDRDTRNMTLEDFLDAHVDLILCAFNRPEVTKETIDETLQISEVVPFTREIFRWLQAQVFAELDKLPNAEAGTEEET